MRLTFLINTVSQFVRKINFSCDANVTSKFVVAADVCVFGIRDNNKFELAEWCTGQFENSIK